ncbi:MAG: ABC transporter permease [Actinobacteria bacterium]|nr:ABC transporter permease [Actinomycetota bacterium]MCL6104079.1 ABC transporter permease [Actinomycetota bacterium]
MGPITSPPIAKEAVSPSPTNSPTTSLASASHEKHLEPGFKQLLSWSITDFVAIAKRNLLRYVRLPNLLVMSVVQPIMFVLLFNYVFGGVLKLTIQGSYIDYLMPGIFAQAVIFGSVQTGIGLAQDLSTGMFDRFRSLPMARSAVLVGRTLADTGRNVFVILLMAGVGAIIGFRFEAGITAAIAAMALVLMFGLSFSWLSAVIGLITKDVEAAQAASIIWIMPLTFASSAFVPVATMPGWLQAFAKADPVSHTANALRSLFMGGPVATQLWETIVWLVGILLVTVPLAVFLYRKAS